MPGGYSSAGGGFPRPQATNGEHDSHGRGDGIRAGKTEQEEIMLLVLICLFDGLVDQYHPSPSVIKNIKIIIIKS